MEQKATLSTEWQEAELTRRIRQVISGAPQGMDEESLNAAVFLLGEIELRQVMLELLQEQKLFGEIGEDGEPVYYAPGRKTA